MVDFQSRDTSRGYGDEDETEDDDDTTETEPEEETKPDEEATTEEEIETDEETVTEEATTAASAEVESAAAASADETAAFGPETLPYAVVTVGSERTVEEDATGEVVVDAVEHAGDAVATRELIGSEYDSVQSTVGTLARRKDVSAIVTVGGTGVSPDDVTIDAVEPLFDKHLPGFGELYRVLSHDFDGTAVVRTRATAGIVDGVPVFCLPGDTERARRGVEQIVLEEAEALAEEARDEEPSEKS
ncbi:MogA/MoaB family molybdenum cofactor biosynthesis protein [Salinibaculum rarum]|uniref:MogA/MoaB family molybdenum cofactor biosynthesis protein n=1 Tax=Salinibaculum rarum TaxID=3058903 RepID=UPI00265EF5E9|nr:MogA/MoaB family molybdenum cofactor biosynthesis protein [Salinibaculum sp. KK48]